MSKSVSNTVRGVYTAMAYITRHGERNVDKMRNNKGMLAEDQYEKTINQGLRTMGRRIWHPDTRARGKRTDQEDEGIRYAKGIRFVERRTIITIVRALMMSARRKRRRIRGTSTKKFDFSTSLIVAPHVMLYEKRCASSAWDRWIEMPPKKKKKNGTQVRFSINADAMLRSPRRYSRRVKATFPSTGKTNVHDNQTSNECR